MAKKEDVKETKVLTTKDDEIKRTGENVETLIKENLDDLKKDGDSDESDNTEPDDDESGIDKFSNADVVVSDEEDFTYEKTKPIAEEPEDIPSFKEVKSALRRLAALSLSTVEFEILKQSFPKIFGE